MSDGSVIDSPVAGVVSGLDAAVAHLSGLDLTSLTDEDCVRLVAGIEVATRRVQAASLPVLREVVVRRAYAKAGCSSPAAMLTSLTRMRPGAARARVAAMDGLTPSVSPSGERIEPRFPETAELVGEGVIGLDHAGVVAKVMAKIPHKIDPVQRENTEAALAELCRKYTPCKVETIGERIVEYLDPDGTLADDADRARRREFTLGKNAANLMAKVSGHLDPSTQALLEVMLGVWAAPGMNNPDDPLSPSGAADDPAVDHDILQGAADNDTRSQAQRNHDALKAMLMYLLESGQLGTTHRGLPVQVIITMTKDQVDQWFQEQAQNAEDAASDAATDNDAATQDQTATDDQTTPQGEATPQGERAGGVAAGDVAAGGCGCRRRGHSSGGEPCRGERRGCGRR